MIQLTPSDAGSFLATSVVGFPLDIEDRGTNTLIGRFFFIPLFSENWAEEEGNDGEVPLACYEVIRRLDTRNPLSCFTKSVTLELNRVRSSFEVEPGDLDKLILVDPLFPGSVNGDLTALGSNEEVYTRIFQMVENNPGTLLSHKGWAPETEVKAHISNMSSHWFPVPNFVPKKQAAKTDDLKNFKISHIRIAPEEMSAEEYLSISRCVNESTLDEPVLSQGGLTFAYEHKIRKGSLKDLPEFGQAELVTIDIFVGIAVCSLEDNFSRSRGRELAIQRAKDIQNSNGHLSASETVKKTEHQGSVSGSKFFVDYFLKKSQEDVRYLEGQGERQSTRMGAHIQIVTKAETWDGMSTMHRQDLFENAAAGTVSKWCLNQTEETIRFKEVSNLKGKDSASVSDGEFSRRMDEIVESVTNDYMFKNVPILQYSDAEIRRRLTEALIRVSSRELTAFKDSIRKKSEPAPAAISVVPEMQSNTAEQTVSSIAPPKTPSTSSFKTLTEGLSALRGLRDKFKLGPRA